MEQRTGSQTETECFPPMDIESAAASLLIFHGSETDPLPQELFMLWDRIAGHNYKTYPCACCLNESYFEIYEYDKEDNAYRSDDDCYWDVTHQEYHPSDTAIGISLYQDRSLGKKMFALLMTTDGEGISGDMYSRNSLVVEAEEWLEDEYGRWAKLREEEPDRYSRPCEVPESVVRERRASFFRSVACETCLASEQCDRMTCMYPERLNEAEMMADDPEEE